MTPNISVIVLGLCITVVMAGGCMSSIRDPDGVDGQPDTEKWAPCKNPPPPHGWYCADKSIDFPTIDCMVADIKACGNVGSGPTIFNSFGASTPQARSGFRDKLNPPGIMFNDALGDDWWDGASGPIVSRPDFDLNNNPARQDFLRKTFSIALAQASAGEVFLVIAGRISGAPDPGLPGAFQNPPSSPNTWRDFELGTLQANPAITAITSVDISNGYKTDTDWVPGGLPIIAPPAIDDHNPPPAPKKRVSSSTVDACSLVAPEATTSSAASSMIIAPPAGSPLSCELFTEDPDHGINQAYCLYDSTLTLSPLTVAITGQYSDSCAYTGVPATSAAEIVTIMIETYTDNCQACTQIQYNAPTCTSVTGCIPTKIVAQVQAGSSPVHIGTLTGTALYTSISSALEALCPPVTQTTTSTYCASTGLIIPGISYVAEESLETDGELTVSAEASAYNATSLRDAMIQAAALTVQTASQGLSNCYNQTYNVEQLKRRVPSRFNLNPWSKRDHPFPESEQIQFCNSVSFAATQYYNPWWRLAPEPGPSNFLCEYLEDLTDEFIAIAPEFAIEDVALGEEIRVTCEEAIQYGLLR